MHRGVHVLGAGLGGCHGGLELIGSRIGLVDVAIEAIQGRLGILCRLVGRGLVETQIEPGGSVGDGGDIRRDGRRRTGSPGEVSDELDVVRVMGQFRVGGKQLGRRVAGTGDIAVDRRDSGTVGILEFPGGSHQMLRLLLQGWQVVVDLIDELTGLGIDDLGVLTDVLRSSGNRRTPIPGLTDGLGELARCRVGVVEGGVDAIDGFLAFSQGLRSVEHLGVHEGDGVVDGLVAVGDLLGTIGGIAQGILDLLQVAEDRLEVRLGDGLVQGLAQRGLHLGGEQADDEAIGIVATQLQGGASWFVVSGADEVLGEVLGDGDDHVVVAGAQTIESSLGVGAHETPVEQGAILQLPLQLVATVNRPVTEGGRLVKIDHCDGHVIGVGVEIPVGVQVHPAVEQRNDEHEEQRQTGASLESAELIFEKLGQVDQHELSLLVVVCGTVVVMAKDVTKGGRTV